MRSQNSETFRNCVVILIYWLFLLWIHKILKVKKIYKSSGIWLNLVKKTSSVDFQKQKLSAFRGTIKFLVPPEHHLEWFSSFNSSFNCRMPWELINKEQILKFEEQFDSKQSPRTSHELEGFPKKYLRKCPHQEENHWCSEFNVNNHNFVSMM